ncbi:hypothetical protein IMG5_195570 [Ichthyophthirius multifiliis]|uniref:Uncharacterized protein n=1 Tax=Ichthyophthirius multifiliis TaxID=5932 RepID=G0R4Z1_ICHMU|nr:hypothetical protein IMG5_195570 [Ichthyophthirius multifiliis]EGR27475.1 hypothetical protein IMG5_195570 [Ichthyophthirius multifiliis]|eukprot:XP_004024385.1 hypothetical protein IMG5_195570 [Ichthyophthirius multifiliis]
MNPLFVSLRDIRVYLTARTDNRVLEKGTKQNSLSTKEIKITKVANMYLWGIHENENISQPFKLFKSAPGGILGPANSVQFKFKVDNILPEGSELTVKIDAQCNGIFENSVVTNLPVLQGKSKVSCFFQLGKIICKNVGAFLNKDTEYFVAVKIFYKNDAPDLTNFGGIEIESLVFDNQGNQINNVSVFRPLEGISTELFTNTEYLDLTGWHKQDVFQFGTSQVLTANDDGSLSSLPNAMQNLMIENQGTIGIVPGNFENQQVIFFLKSSYNQMTKSPLNKKIFIRLNIMFNPKIIQIKRGFETLGIDFVGYNNVLKRWDVDFLECYKEFKSLSKTRKIPKCTWYDKPQDQQVNTIDNIENTVNSNKYSFARFECGAKDDANYVADQCNNFQGYKVDASGDILSFSSAVVSLRHVSFPQGFHSQLYPDQDLLDFVVSFEEAEYISGQLEYKIVTAQLINAYTIQGYYLNNIKVSYVNFYGGSAMTNNGMFIPTMIRIGGTILNQEFLNSNKILVFLDSLINAESFLENASQTQDRSIGCSFGTCEYVKCEGTVSGENTWMNQKHFEVSNVHNVENEFNLLIPLQNEVDKLPKNVVLAFANQSRNSLGVEGLVQIVSVYRVFGPAVQGNLKIVGNGQYGAGLTISSFSLNIFDLALDEGLTEEQTDINDPSIKWKYWSCRSERLRRDVLEMWTITAYRACFLIQNGTGKAYYWTKMLSKGSSRFN